MPLVAAEMGSGIGRSFVSRVGTLLASKVLQVVEGTVSADER